jgi:putative serine protease PepD
VSYQEKNVAQDRAAATHMVQLTGQMGVPVTEINGSYIVGFNQPALKAAVTQLRAKRQTDGVKLGAQVADAAKLLNQPGAVLGKIRPGGLAEQAGLREGDIITSLNGQPVTSSGDLALALQKLTAQSPLPKFTVMRDGQLV